MKKYIILAFLLFTMVPGISNAHHETGLNLNFASAPCKLPSDFPKGFKVIAATPFGQCYSLYVYPHPNNFQEADVFEAEFLLTLEYNLVELYANGSSEEQLKNYKNGLLDSLKKHKEAINKRNASLLLNQVNSDNMD